MFRSQQRLCLLCDYLRYTVVALNRRYLVAAATAGSLNDWLSFTRQCVPPARVWWDSCLLERIVRSLIVWKKIKTSTDLMRLMCIMVWLYSFCHLSVVFCGFVNLLWLVGRSCDNQKISVCKKKRVYIVRTKKCVCIIYRCFGYVEVGMGWVSAILLNYERTRWSLLTGLICWPRRFRICLVSTDLMSPCVRVPYVKMGLCLTF